MIFGRPFKKVSNLSEVVSFKIPLVSETAGTGQPIAMGDLSGDKKDDLFISRVSSGTIFVIPGQSSPGPSIDLNPMRSKSLERLG